MVLTPDNNFVRYCKPNQIQDGEVLSTAFRLRPKNIAAGREHDETELSVDWFEYFTSKHYQNIKRALNDRGLETRPNGMLVKINVDKACILLRTNSCPITISVEDTSHGSIIGLYGKDTTVDFLFLTIIDEKMQISDI